MPPADPIEIRPSATLSLCLSAVHCAAAAAIWFAYSPAWIRVLLVVAVAGSLGWSILERALSRTRRSTVALAPCEPGWIAVLSREGHWTRCAVLGSTYVSARMTVLNLRPQGRRIPRHVVLVPDNIDAGDYRRLRTWLRWRLRDGAAGAP